MNTIRTLARAAIALVPTFAIAAAACKPAPSAPPCPSTLRELPAAQQGTSSVTCSCPANAGSVGGTVWGDGTYTTDSNICKSAVHAGVVSAAGGTVTVNKSAGCSAYASSTSNGVTSQTWGPWDTSFYFSGKGSGTCPAGAAAAATSAPPAAAAASPAVAAGPAAGSPSTACPSNFLAIPDQASVGRFVCKCNAGSATGSVWGSSLYTRDSSICAAAAHAGAISSTAGGVVTVQSAPPCKSYSSSTKNGVTSGAWGSFDRGSYSFVGFGAGTCDP
jgi:hypothetical protein